MLYLLKANLALGLLYIIYKLLFQHDTFFQLRRFVLLAFYATAFLYPLTDISSWLSVQSGVTDFVVYYSAVIESAAVVDAADVAATEAVTGGSMLITYILWGIYLLVFALLCIRLLIELIIVVKTYIKSEKVYVKGNRIVLLPEPGEPYSFFNWIFIHPASYSKNTLHEIITHESTHVHQLHSMDVLLGELVRIVFWFNPFAWLMKREMTINHEYIADDEVVQCGYDKKEYQYHMIGMESSTQAAAKLYNYFSLLPLKKRITMLNKERTNKALTLKYLLCLPLVAALLVVNNIDAMARGQSNDASVANVSQETEKLPTYTDGNAELFKHIARYVKYPVIAQENEIQGRILAAIVVDKEGTVTDIKITRSLYPVLDAELLRVLKTIPDKWLPYEEEGVKMDSEYTLAFTFRLQGIKDTGEITPNLGDNPYPTEREIVVVGYSPM